MAVEAPSSDATRAGVRAVATALLPELPAIGEGTAAHILARMPQFAHAGAEDLVLGSCQSNSAALLDALIRGVPLDATGPSVEVVESTRAFVQRGLSLATVVRAYRLGIAYWCERWAQGVARHAPEPAAAVAVVSAGTAFLLGWLEPLLDRLADEMRDEAERLARDGALARAEEVRRVLADPAYDPAAAGLRLGYDLGARHVGLVLRRHDGAPADGTALDAAAQGIAAALTTARPLVVRVDVATAWCWVALQDPGAVEVPPPARPVVAALGRPAVGVDGFRRTHQEAQEAMRVAALAGRGPGTITRFEQVELAAVCSADPRSCRAFVAEQLGPLAADDDATRRIRATLETFFATGSNFRATAKRLGVHHNTVRYRLARAERLLGRPAGEGRLALEMALHLANRLGPAVLGPAGR